MRTLTTDAAQVELCDSGRDGRSRHVRAGAAAGSLHRIASRIWLRTGNVIPREREAVEALGALILSEIETTLGWAQEPGQLPVMRAFQACGRPAAAVLKKERG